MKRSCFAAPTFLVLVTLLISGCSPAVTIPTPTSTAIPTATTLPPTVPSTESASNCPDSGLKLVSWWRGEGDTTDSTGNHDGMFISNTAYAPGKVGRAFRFNGIDNLVAVPDSDEWTLGAKDFTIDMWVNFNDIRNRTAFIGHDEGGGSTNKWIFWYDELGDDGSPGPALRFHINPSTGLRNPIFALWTPVVGQWYHLAITRNASKYALYIDGVQVATSIHTDEISNAVAPLTIGSSEGFFFNGLIDEVHLFSRGLSAAEIQMIFNAGSKGICALNTVSGLAPLVTPEPTAPLWGIQ